MILSVPDAGTIPNCADTSFPSASVTVAVPSIVVLTPSPLASVAAAVDVIPVT